MMLKRHKHFKECSSLRLFASKQCPILFSMSWASLSPSGCLTSFSALPPPVHSTPITLAWLFCDLTKPVPTSEPLPGSCL